MFVEAEELNQDDFKWIETGGFGLVYRVNGREPPTALKIIQKRHDKDLELFQREFENIKALQHEHIVEYYGIGFWRQQFDDVEAINYGIMMELCKRGSLTNWLYKKTFVYSIETVIWWSHQLFSALAYLEERRTVHRDLKPANVLVCDDFRLKLCDFGTTKVNEQTCTAHSLVGTTRYMSPEQQEKAPGDPGKRQVSRRSDVYCMGLILWEIIERRKVFYFYGDYFDYAKAGEAQELHDDFCHNDSDLLPQSDETQMKLLKPIGFDGSRERRMTVDEYESSKESLSDILHSRISSISSDWSRAGSSMLKATESLNTDSSSAPFSYIRGAYFTNWSQHKTGRARFSPNDYIPGICTHLFYAFSKFDTNFKVGALEENDLDLLNGDRGQYKLLNDLKKKQPDLKILLSIGGAAFGTKLFEAMTSTRANREIFIASAISWVREHSFDGIDICWQQPRNQDQDNYANLLSELREAIESEEVAAFGREKLLLSAAVSPIGHRMKSYNIPSMAKSLDFVNLLCFHYWHSVYEQTTGMISPLYGRKGLSAEDSERNINWSAHQWHHRGFPKHKILIGVPTFGHGWDLWDTSKNEPGSRDNHPTDSLPDSNERGCIAYYEVCDLLDGGLKSSWHDEHKVPWLVENGRWWTYDCPQSVAIKMQFIRTNGFGGATAWCLDLDDFKGLSQQHGGIKYPLIATIAKVLGRPQN
ncbi:unnamed protein product, partial [Mesorhabditis belari]|uniref:Uncharacterized protein n=1 Tax=Mesorhabditis belari TaxID=2138241 RepID=A0AAF3F512_9BILA